MENESRRFLSPKEVSARIGFCKTHLWRKIKAGEFPRPVPLGAQKVGFLESEVEAWIDGRLRARENGEGSAQRREIARAAVSQAPHVRRARGAVS